MYPQNAFTLITEIESSKLAELRDTLKIIQKDVEDNPYFNFNKIITIHFARFVILEEVKKDGKIIYPAYLAFESNYDGPLDLHLLDIISSTQNGGGFDKVFSACKKFPTGSITDGDRVKFLKTDSRYHPYFYRGTWGRTVLQIRAEDQVRSDIESYLDKNTTIQSKSEKEIYDVLKSKIKPSPRKTEYPPKFTSLLWILVPLIAIIIYSCFIQSWALLLVLISIALVIAAIGLFFFILRNKEKIDQELTISYDANTTTVSLRDAEDRIVQNQLTHLVELKEGSFRLFSLKMVLFLVETLGIYKFNKGQLGGIPSIHFARWLIIDNGKRLLFFSNFDGSWENYLGDFIDRAAVGLTAVWSNTKLFPKSRFLVLDGATNEQKFKSWTRMHQIQTQVWYSAYKYLTVENINKNTSINDGLAKQLNDTEVKDWLLKF